MIRQDGHVPRQCETPLNLSEDLIRFAIFAVYFLTGAFQYRREIQNVLAVEETFGAHNILMASKSHWLTK